MVEEQPGRRRKGATLSSPFVRVLVLVALLGLAFAAGIAFERTVWASSSRRPCASSRRLRGWRRAPS